jgi:hypothetical protein
MPTVSRVYLFQNLPSFFGINAALEDTCGAPLIELAFDHYVSL